jgi:hypothetical protein
MPRPESDDNDAMRREGAAWQHDANALRVFQSDVASRINSHYDEIVVFLTREGLGLSAGGGMGGLPAGADENGDGEPAAAERDEGMRRTLGTARS